MAFIRQNVWELGGDWPDPVLWYARGVAALQARPLADPTSWRFFGAMHGIDQGLWQQLGYLATTDTFPSDALVSTYWNQCQHGSWYFLPWHRGYLLAFEANIRAAVVALGGPSDWALPYWNYFKAHESKLPPAFGSANWPDGHGNNPLYVPQRYGPENNGKVYVPVKEVNLKALNDPDFTGVSSGGSPGFGGVDTGFSHGGQVHGGIETQPHDMVHGLVGGSNPTNQELPGLMSDPDTAALDPIFWLHHGNIDRLWQVWRQNPSTDIDPTDPNWLQGPGSVGERVFAAPNPDGTTWNYTPMEVDNYGSLDYTYDDLSPALPPSTPRTRLNRLGLAAALPEVTGGATNVSTGNNVELVGANQGALEIQGNETSTSVLLDQPTVQKVVKSLGIVQQTFKPDRVFLNIENVRGTADATSYDVYVGLPSGANVADHPELLAGNVTLFGVRKASLPNGEHGGQGLTFVLDISDIVDQLQLSNRLDVDSIDVRLVPVRPAAGAPKVTIGRVSIYRQGN
jgi:tyrosinase